MKSSKDPKFLREERVGNIEVVLLEGDITAVGGGVIIIPSNWNLSKLPGLTSKIIEAAGNRMLL